MKPTFFKGHRLGRDCRRDLIGANRGDRRKLSRLRQRDVLREHPEGAYRRGG